MFKWIVLTIVILVATVFVIKIIKTMLKIEKESNKTEKVEENKVEEQYQPQQTQIDLSSSSATIITDMSNNPKELAEVKDEEIYGMPSGFNDKFDDEFNEYSRHAHNRKGRRRIPDNFDLDGDFADELSDGSEYIPSSPDFSYLHNRKKQKQPLKKELQDLPTELKVLMLSDIFDRKFDQ